MRQPPLLISLLTLFAGFSGLAAQNDAALTAGSNATEEIKSILPPGWKCTITTEKRKMGHFHGLDEPEFRLDFVNPKETFDTMPLKGEAPQRITPNLRLDFYSISERSHILQIIEKEKMFSWSIPTLFAETKDYIIVSSPAWSNRDSKGTAFHTKEALDLIAPLETALYNYFKKGVEQGAAANP